jgi:23S rRNA (adenine2030-N6)-methyltransferase
MLSYRHGFHAGNPADVLKHSVLVFCLDYLTQKETPLLCVDTHAGAGSYPLREGFASQNREWENGVDRLRRAAETDGGKMPAMLRRYLQICAAPDSYSGSPLIMTRLLRPIDRLVCFELHPADHGACEAALRGRAEVRLADGFCGLTALLPPPSRRGLILVDPPYEVKDDYARLPQIIAGALRRFSGGVYLVWYPLLRNPPPAAGDLPGRLMDLYRGSRCRIELYTANSSASLSRSPRGMFGSGLLVYNPPWTLAAALEESLPILGAAIGAGANNWKIETHD